MVFPFLSLKTLVVESEPSSFIHFLQAIVAHNMQLLSMSGGVQELFTVERCREYYGALSIVTGFVAVV